MNLDQAEKLLGKNLSNTDLKNLLEGLNVIVPLMNDPNDKKRLDAVNTIFKFRKKHQMDRDFLHLALRAINTRDAKLASVLVRAYMKLADNKKPEDELEEKIADSGLYKTLEDMSTDIGSQVASNTVGKVSNRGLKLLQESLQRGQYKEKGLITIDDEGGIFTEKMIEDFLEKTDDNVNESLKSNIDDGGDLQIDYTFTANKSGDKWIIDFAITDAYVDTNGW